MGDVVLIGHKQKVHITIEIDANGNFTGDIIRRPNFKVAHNAIYTTPQKVAIIVSGAIKDALKGLIKQAQHGERNDRAEGLGKDAAGAEPGGGDAAAQDASRVSEVEASALRADDGVGPRDAGRSDPQSGPEHSDQGAAGEGDGGESRIPYAALDDGR